MRHFAPLLLFCVSAFAQPVANPLKAIKSVYVGSFGEGPGSDLIRSKVIASLVKSHRISVVERSEQADAILTGVGEVATLQRDGDSVPNATAGVRLLDRAGKILWADNASSSRIRLTGSATSSLADRIVKSLLKAM